MQNCDRRAIGGTPSARSTLEKKTLATCQVSPQFDRYEYRRRRGISSVNWLHCHLFMPRLRGDRACRCFCINRNIALLGILIFISQFFYCRNCIGCDEGMADYIIINEIFQIFQYFNNDKFELFKV